jgi:ElaB/YqjD/DUF883 family membrane-anchored ribosome-binding protein
MTEISIDDISKTVKDSLYVTIGLGVIAFQKAQVQRQELQKQVNANLAGTRSLVGDSLKTVQERLEAVEGRIDEVLDDVEQQLPEQARSVMRQARDVAKDTRTQLLDLVDANTSASTD